MSQDGSATLTQSVASGTAITWRYKSSTSSGSFSGSYTTLSASSTVDCPIIVTVSGSQALGTCSGGAQTSTLTVTNTSGSTAYVKVEYSTDGGSSYTTADANATISNGTGSLFTQSVSDGSAITWRFTSSDTSADFTGLTPTTLSASSTVDCPQAVTVSSSQSLGSCSSGAATSTLTVSNSSGSTAYLKVEYSTDGGSSYSTDSSNSALVSGASSTFTQSVSHDSAITWRVTSSDTSNSFTGLTPSTVASSTVDCPVIDVSASQSLGSCSSGAATSTLTLANSNSANATAYFLVEYSVDGGSNWTQKAANQSVAKNASETLTQSVSHDSAITWRYKSSTSSGSFSGSYTTLSASSTVDCPIIDTSVSNTRNACSGGAKLTHFHMANSDSANADAYFFVEYSLDGGSNWSTLVANQSVAPNSSESASVNVPHGQNVRWRYKTSTTSNSFSGSYSTWGPDFTVDCPTVDVSVSATLGTCSSGSATSSFAITNSASATTTAYIKVEYKIDSGSWQVKEANQSVGIDSTETLTHSVPVGSNITWRYEESTSSATFTGTPTATGSASSDVSCNITASASQTLSASCTGASKTSTLAISNSGSSQATAYFLIEYSIDGGSNWVQKEASKSVTVGGSDTVTHKP